MRSFVNRTSALLLAFVWIVACSNEPSTADAQQVVAQPVAKALPPATPMDSAIQWVSLEEAQHLQKNAPRKVFIDFYDPDCEDCQALFDGALSHPWIITYLNKHYYPVKFDITSKAPVVFQGNTFENTSTETDSRYHDLVYTLGDMDKDGITTPTMVFLDEAAAYLTFIEGPYPADRLEPILRFLGENIYLTTPYETYMASYKSELNK